MAFLHTQLYSITAQIIRKLPAETKQQVADLFATEFRKRFKNFDAALWERETGGKVKGFNIHTGKFEDADG